MIVRKDRLKLAIVAAAAAGVGMLASPPAVQAAVNYFDTTRIVTGTGTAYCPSGTRVTGGGTYPLPADYFGSSSSTEYAVTGSYPASTTSWKATGTRVTGSYSSSYGWRFTKWSYSPRVYAVCAS